MIEILVMSSVFLSLASFLALTYRSGPGCRQRFKIHSIDYKFWFWMEKSYTEIDFTVEYPIHVYISPYLQVKYRAREREPYMENFYLNIKSSVHFNPMCDLKCFLCAYFFCRYGNFFQITAFDFVIFKFTVTLNNWDKDQDTKNKCILFYPIK